MIGRRQDEGDAGLRRVLLAGQDVDYRLIRARRQSIGMTIDNSGLVVRAPRWVTIREIDLALKERARWVVETLAEWRGRNRESLPTEWHAGAPLLFQGRALTLALFPARKKAIAADLLHLTVLHPDPGDESEIAAFCCRWLKEQALSLLTPLGNKGMGEAGAIGPMAAIGNAVSNALGCCVTEVPLTLRRVRQLAASAQ